MAPSILASNAQFGETAQVSLIIAAFAILFSLIMWPFVHQFVKKASQEQPESDTKSDKSLQPASDHTESTDPKRYGKVRLVNDEMASVIVGLNGERFDLNDGYRQIMETLELEANAR